MNRTLVLLTAVFLIVACGKKSNYTPSPVELKAEPAKQSISTNCLTNSQIPVDSVKMDKKGRI